MIQTLLFNERLIEALVSNDKRCLAVLTELGITHLLDIDGRLWRSLVNPDVRLLYVDSLTMDYWGLVGRIRDTLLGCGASGVSVISIITLWCMARRDFGVDASIALYKGLVYLGEASRLSGNTLTVWVEDWFQRRHEYIYNILRRLSTSIKSILL